MGGNIIAVIGGARSGKSKFAKELALKLNRRTVFVATARCEDGEMEERIARHQADRPAEWKTVEADLDLATAIQQSALEADVLIVDCLSIYISNLLFQELESSALDGDSPYPPGLEGMLVLELEKVFKAAQAVSALVIFVSNEVGLGIVPLYQSARLYRDVSGRVNQLLVNFSQRAFWVQAGIAIELKSLAVSVEELVRELEYVE